MWVILSNISLQKQSLLEPKTLLQSQFIIQPHLFGCNNRFVAAVDLGQIWQSQQNICQGKWTELGGGGVMEVYQLVFIYIRSNRQRIFANRNGRNEKNCQSVTNIYQFLLC